MVAKNEELSVTYQQLQDEIVLMSCNDLMLLFLDIKKYQVENCYPDDSILAKVVDAVSYSCSFNMLVSLITATIHSEIRKRFS